MPKKNTVIFSWNPIHDALLIQLAIEKTKGKKWSKVAEEFKKKTLRASPEHMECFPTGKQCRERWANQLDPSLSREKFTKEQIIHIIKRKKEGIGFAAIGRELNHSANQVKNTFYSKVNSKDFRRSLNVKKLEAIDLEAFSFMDQTQNTASNSPDSPIVLSDSVPISPIYSVPLQNHGLFASQPLFETDETCNFPGLEEQAQEILESSNFFSFEQ